MTEREIVISQLRHIETPIVPYTMHFEQGIAEKLTQYYGGDEWKQKCDPFMRHVLTVDTVQMREIDELYSVDGYGAKWRMDKVPWHLDTPPLDEPDFSRYHFPDYSQFTDPIRKNKAEAIKKCEAETGRFRLITMGWGLFEHSWRIRGFENALMDVVAEPEFYETLISRLADLFVAMLRELEDIPADGILFGDDWGEQRGVMIGARRWRELIKPHWKRVFDEVHRQGKFVLSHSCGSIHDIYNDCIEIGMDAHESVQPEAANMNPYKLKREFGDRITFWGCVGNQSLIPFGTPAEIRDEVRRLREAMAVGGGYIMAPAKPVDEATPLENAVALFEAFAEHP